VRVAGAMNVKALRTGVRGRVTAAELAQVILEAEHLCNYCGIEVPDMEGSFDHVIPFDRLGDNLPHNIVRCCVACNRMKATMSVEELEQYAALRVTCHCGVVFRPRWADWKRGYGRTHSRVCSGQLGGRRRTA
jgi:hypothetical protein